jgi:hypothetical protein
MKKILTKKILLTTLIMFIATVGAFSQGSDSDFQRLLSKTQPILDKSVENFTKDDINSLNSVIELSADSFGESNTRLLNNLINQAKTKKREYDDFIVARKNMATTLDMLDDETALRIATEEREEILIGENTSLKELIQQLQANIAKLEQQAKKMSQANKKLQEENLAAKELLQTSSNLVAQMLMLMPPRSLDDATMQELPESLRDSLETAQCGISQILKSNFLITIQQLKANQPFMDSAIVHFKTNKSHSLEIANYVDNCKELVNRLRRSGIDCAVGYASDIENEMNGFLLLVENSEAGTKNFADFILDNIIWIAPLCLMVLFGIILLIRRTSSKKLN